MRRLTGRRALALWLVVCGTLCLGLGAAVGGPVNPYIEVHETAEWQALLDAGAAGGGGGGGGALIRPVSAQSFFDLVMQDPEQWPVEYRPVGVFGGETLFSTPELSAPVNGHEDGQGNTQPALEMRWGPDAAPQPGQRVAAAWDLVYPDDPDLSNMRLEFSIHTPGPSMFFSVNIVDQAGNYREWIWHSGDPGEVPPCTWTTVTIDPVAITASSNFPQVSGSPFVVNTTGQFDITKVAYIRFNENGIWQDPGHMDPTGEWIWNAWDHVEVHPEPATMVLLGSGLLGLVLRRRKRK